MLSEAVIETAVRNFRDALRIMDRDGTTMHVFDFGRATNGENYVVLLTVIPEEALAEAEKQVGLTRQNAAPLTPAAEPETRPEKTNQLP